MAEMAQSTLNGAAQLVDTEAGNRSSHGQTMAKNPLQNKPQVLGPEILRNSTAYSTRVEPLRKYQNVSILFRY